MFDDSDTDNRLYTNMNSDASNFQILSAIFLKTFYNEISSVSYSDAAYMASTE